MSLQELTDDELIQYYKLMKKTTSWRRKEITDKHGEDVKYLYHILRLFDEVEQILLEGDLDLQRAREPMKAIRRGEWSSDEVRRWAMEKEVALEKAYVDCKLPEKPPVEPLRQLLINCLEEHYGSLDNCIAEVGWAEQALKEIDSLLGKHRRKLYV